MRTRREELKKEKKLPKMSRTAESGEVSQAVNSLMLGRRMRSGEVGLELDDVARDLLREADDFFDEVGELTDEGRDDA